MKLGLYLHAALRSFPYLGSYVLEFVNNQTQSVGKTEGDTSPHSFAPPLSFRLVLTDFGTPGMLRPARSYCSAS